MGLCLILFPLPPPPPLALTPPPPLPPPDCVVDWSGTYPGDIPCTGVISGMGSTSSVSPPLSTSSLPVSPLLSRLAACWDSWQTETWLAGQWGVRVGGGEGGWGVAVIHMCVHVWSPCHIMWYLHSGNLWYCDNHKFYCEIHVINWQWTQTFIYLLLLLVTTTVMWARQVQGFITPLIDLINWHIVAILRNPRYHRKD